MKILSLCPNCCSNAVVGILGLKSIKPFSLSQLFFKKLYFLGDQIAGMLAVAVASSRTLEVLDLEGTGLTNQSAQVHNTYENTTVYSGINTESV